MPDRRTPSKGKYTADRNIPGAFEGETITRRRLMTLGAHTAGGVAVAAFTLPALGFAAGALIIGIDVLYKLQAEPGFREAAAKAAGVATPLSHRVTALLYGGVAEEVMLRYGVMTLLVWLGAWLAGNRFAETPGLVVWPAIVLSAVLFGLGHLPKAVTLGPLDAATVIRIVGLNAIGGLVYGWLYWRAGLEHAMLAHMATHVAFWTMTPLLLRLLA